MDYLNAESDTGIKLPALATGAFHISGISAIMRDAEVMKNIREIILPLTGNPNFMPYMNPYKIIQSIERRLNLRDEGIIVRPEEAAVIDKKMRAMTAMSVAEGGAESA